MEHKEIGLLGYAAGGLNEIIMQGINQARIDLALPWMFRDGGWQGELLKGPISKNQLAGFIGNIVTQEALSLLKKTGLQVVNTSNTIETPFPSVSTKMDTAGVIAAEHFLELGHRRLLFASDQPHHPRDQAIWSGLKRTVENTRVTAWFWKWSRAECLDQVGEETLQAIGKDNGPTRFLDIVQRPFAVLASNDRLGKLFCEGGLVRGFRTPEEIAILGMGDNPLYCLTATPTLSSVRYPGYEIGYQAVRILNELLEGKAPESLQLASPGISKRRSTESTPIENPHLAKFLNRMRAHYNQRVSIQDLCRGIPMDRRSLERGIREILGRSPLDELYRLRISQAQELLQSTSHTMSAIADRCGFRNADHFSQRFKREVGIPPSEFRKRTRLH